MMFLNHQDAVIKFVLIIGYFGYMQTFFIYEGFGEKLRALGILLKSKLCQISDVVLFRCLKQWSACFFPASLLLF